MAWIESHTKLSSHPKVKHLARLMEWDICKTIGALHCFWYWCVDYAENGDLSKYNDDQIAESVGLNGESATRFVVALKTSGWVDPAPFQIHDWWDFTKNWWRAKYKRTPEKWRKIEARYVPDTEPNQTRHNTPKEKKESNPLHSVFISLWIQSYQEQVKAPYLFSYGKDNAAVAKLLTMVQGEITVEDIILVAVTAWQNPKGFWCEKAFTIAGFATHFNNIYNEIKHKFNPKTNPTRQQLGLA